MRYTAFFFESLRIAIGTDFGILNSPGLAETGMFHIQCGGPLGLAFNFGDADFNAKTTRAWEMFWLARTFDRPVYAAHERLVPRDNKIDAFHLFWFNPAGSEKDIEALP